ncbi:MAG TPA: hypothetical protein VGA77_06630 [Propylenella sp.]
MAFFITNVAAKAAADAVVDLVDGGAGAGLLRIYAGSVPADADAALGGATLLATLTMSDPAFGAAADAAPGATATASAITSDTSADATGTASFFRLLDSNALAIMQGLVTATGGGGDMEINSVSITSGVTVQCTSFTYTQPES